MARLLVGGGDRSRSVQAPWPSELVSQMPVVHYPSHGPRVWNRIAHVAVPGVRPGDSLDVMASILVTNDLGYGVEFAGCLVLTRDPTGTCGVESVVFSQSGGMGQQSDRLRFITRVPGFNVSPQKLNYPSDAYPSTEFEFPGAHHETITLGKFWTTPQDLTPGDYWVAALFYAGGSTRTASGDKLIVEPFGTDLSAKHTPGA